jgi:hypothetical protein
MTCAAAAVRDRDPEAPGADLHVADFVVDRPGALPPDPRSMVEARMGQA